ncbi:MAG: hypothetical protein ACI9LV_000900 [Candidatus Nanohaloarchaea archaeon]|jgi:phosphoglycolate phosphatase-like HAD superfamily hydrolase
MYTAFISWILNPVSIPAKLVYKTGCNNGDMEAVIDLDGTISDNSHRKHLIEGESKNWKEYLKRCSEDEAVSEVLDFVKELRSDHRIVIITARSEEVRERTVNWLNEKDVPYDQLFMLEKDKRNIEDHEFKREKLERLENPVLAVDDKESNLRMFREEGLKSYMVNGNGEIKHFHS